MPTSLPTELILAHSQRSLGVVYLDWVPQPGTDVTHAGDIYTVLERRHRYQFKANQYHLYQVALYVQKAQITEEKSLINHRWVVGDASCYYNAHSELLRCTINPEGPCRGCLQYRPQAP